MTITKERLRQFARYDITAKELMTDNHMEDIKEEYAISLEDVKEVLSKLSCMSGKASYDFYEEWLFHITLLTGLSQTLKAPYYLVSNKLAKPSEDGLLHNDFDAMYYVVKRLDKYFYDFEKGKDTIDVTPLIEAVDCYEANVGKPFTEWNFPNQIKDAYVRYIDSQAKEERKLTDEQIALFKRYVDELIACGNTAAIRIKGESPVFALDAKTQGEYLQKAFDLDGDSETAYSLGMFYYDQNDYVKAFSYFSYGQMFQHFDSTVKLADMYKTGCGTFKSPHAQEKIIRQAYERERKRFCQSYDNRFVEAAYLMGEMLEDSTEYPGVAYYRYLEAEYANAQEKTNFTKKISQALKRTKKTVKQKKDTIIQRHVDEFLMEVLEGGYTCAFDAEKEENGFCITLSRLSSNAPKILLTFADHGFCRLVDKIILHIQSDAEELLTDVLFDNYTIDYSKDGNARTILYLDTNPLLELPEQAEFNIKDYE